MKPKAARKVQEREEGGRGHRKGGRARTIVPRSHVDNGIEHVLGLKLPERRNILRYHFRLSKVEIDGSMKSVYKLSMADTAIALKGFIPALPPLPTGDEGNPTEDINGGDDLGDGGGAVAAPM